MALIFFSLFIHKIHSLYIITAIIFTVIITIILIIIIIMANEKSSKKRAVKVLHFSNGHSLAKVALSFWAQIMLTIGH